MKFVHTADIHLDAGYAAAGLPASFANRRRQGLRDVFHAIVARAGDIQADALLIAGDLFDLARVTRDTIAFLQGQFESIPHVPVFIAPGNHDPCMPGSPYLTDPWPSNVHIFKQPEWTSATVPGRRLVVHGFAFDAWDISRNPFGSLAIEDDGPAHVAVAHGSERQHQPPDGHLYAPFDAPAAAALHLAYLALGHFHNATEIPAGGTCMYYSGAPEGHDFSETGPHYYLEVELDESGVRVTRVPSAQIVYETRDVDCSTAASSQDLIDRLRGLARTDVKLAARVTLSGSCPLSLIGELPAVKDAVAAEFDYLDLIDSTSPLEDYNELARDTTSLGEFVARLNEAIHDAPDLERRAVLERAREVGLAAYRGQRIGIRGIELGGKP
jgi:exonuclease SbcD